MMRTILIALTMLSTSVMANEKLKISGWKETAGITQEQALEKAREAIQQDIAIVEDGEVCGVERMWNWEREADLIADLPQERGEIFAIFGFARGPHPEMACSATATYDCRVVFNRPKKNSLWRVKYVECEPGGILNQD